MCAYFSQVGMAMDEGLANPLDEYTVFYGERTARWINVTAHGPTGHGSRFIKGEIFRDDAEGCFNS